MVLGLIVVAGAATALAAQELRPLQDPLVPAGRLRLGFMPSFTSWDSRFGRRTVDGQVVEEEEPLGLDLTDPTGASLFPEIHELQEQLRLLTAAPGYDALLGAVSGIVTQNVTRLDFSAHVGVFDWLTVGATLPWIKTRTAVEVDFRSLPGADLGLNPILEDNGAVSAYLQEVETAASSAEARALQICGADPGGVGCTAAESLAVRARAFADRSRAAYLASAFFPVAGSAVGEAYGDAASALSGDLTSAELPGVGTPLFAGQPLDAEGFAGLTTDPAAGIRATPLESVDPLWAAGDLEVSATVRLLDGEVRDSGAATPRFSWTVAGGGLVRLGTGTRDDPDVLLDVGTGDGQTDVEGFGYAALRVGGRLGVRAGARYGVQGATTLLRRVAAPERILAPAALTRAVRWTPGNYLDLTVSPRFWLDETLSLAVDYRRYHKGADTYTLAAPAGDATDPDASLLASETEVDRTELAVGLRYSTLSDWRAGVSAGGAERAGGPGHQRKRGPGAADVADRPEHPAVPRALGKRAVVRGNARAFLPAVPGPRIDALGAPGPGPLRGLQELPGVLARRGRLGIPTQHPSDLLDAGVSLQEAYVGGGASVPLPLLDQEVSPRP